jgi:hypothetical protein
MERKEVYRDGAISVASGQTSQAKLRLMKMLTRKT